MCGSRNAHQILTMGCAEQTQSCSKYNLLNAFSLKSYEILPLSSDLALTSAIYINRMAIIFPSDGPLS